MRKRRRRRVRRREGPQLLQRRVALGARGVVVLVDISVALGRVDRKGVARHVCVRDFERCGCRGRVIDEMHVCGEAVAAPSFADGVSMRLFACQSLTAFGWRRAVNAVVSSTSAGVAHGAFAAVCELA